jgi:hypothetical protein
MAVFMHVHIVSAVLMRVAMHFVLLLFVHSYS